MEGVGGGKTRVDKGEWKNNIREELFEDQYKNKIVALYQ